jgi:hypothetical protein
VGGGEISRGLDGGWKMADSLKLVKVFLASPGDLAAERTRIREIVDELNYLHAEHTGYHIDLVGWEDTVSTIGRPQQVINEDLDKCELFIGLVWARWGTPSGPNYTSGFEEEFERSLLRQSKTGKPDMSLFFKAIDAARMQDPGDQLQMVLKFKDKIKTERTLLYEEFSSEDQLERKIKRCLVNYIQKLQKADKANLPADVQSQSVDNNAKVQEIETGVSGTPYVMVEALEFLEKFLEIGRKPKSEFSPIDIARYRLIGNSYARGSNDEMSLGSHDANLLFKEKNKINFSRVEISNLALAGLVNFSNEISPLWHWAEITKGWTKDFIGIHSYVGTTAERIGALQALRHRGAKIGPFEFENLKRELVVASWFDDNVDKKITVEGLNYLGDYGTEEDIKFISAAIDRAVYQTVEPATDAMLKLLLREGKVDALKFLIERQSNSASSVLIDEVFSNGHALPISALSEAVRHRNARIRRHAASILANRGELAPDTATALLEDENVDIRLTAIRHLVKSGLKYTDAEARAILVKPDSRSGRDAQGEAAWEQFREDRLRKLTEKELRAEIAGDNEFDPLVYYVFADRFFAKEGGALRKNVSDLGQSEMAAMLQGFADKFGESADVIKTTQNIDAYLRQKKTRRALDVIVSHMQAGDLELVRNALASGFLGYSSKDVAYFKKHGEWADIRLLINMLRRGDEGGALAWYVGTESRSKELADAIYSIGKGRISDLLKYELPDSILRRIILLFSKGDIRELAEDELMSLLLNADAAVRKAASLKIVQHLPLARIAEILNKYLDGDRTFYNVIFWLDTGVSLPRSESEKVVRHALAGM